MPTANQSRARKLAISVAELLAPYVGNRAAMKTLWHPAFASKAELKDPIVNVRAISRGRTDDGRVTGARDVVIEISVVVALPKPTTGQDSWNQNDTIDGLDALAEELFDLFVRVDPTEQPAGSTAGALSQRPVWKYLPANAPEQTSTIENAVLESDRLFLTVFTVPYRRWE
jgi:hypothetical protein